MTQPEALRLAERIDGWVHQDEMNIEEAMKAAAELCRLAEVEGQRDALLAALKGITGHINKRFTGGVWDRARAAIKAVEGEKT